MSPDEIKHDNDTQERQKLTSSASMPTGGTRPTLPSSNSMPLPTTSHRSLEKQPANIDSGLRRSSRVLIGRHDSNNLDDADARMVMESTYNRNSKQGLPLKSNNADEAQQTATSLGNRGNAGVQFSDTWSSASTLQQLKESESFGDVDLASHARLAAQFEDSSSQRNSSSNKIMTPSQFERYRREQELRRTSSNATKSDDSEGSDYEEEDDEVEKSREAEKQRRKQEAHLSVYRQQMMKVTGQEAPAPVLRAQFDRNSASTPNLLTTHFLTPGGGGSGKSSEIEEDDEIPLAILAAHGFPNRNRPPTRLASTSSNPNLRASIRPLSMSPSSNSNIGEPTTGRGDLPVFARNLPKDPYFGASLVNPSNRESLAFGAGGSVRGAPSPSPGLPPGGLVGVIANEERARAMRRGSPNPQAGLEQRASRVPTPNEIPRPYTMMNMTVPGSLGPSLGLGQGPQPGLLSPSEQAQLQLSQQMSNVMQLQIQWMQQMMQMQGNVPGAPQPMLPGSLAPPMPASPGMRPVSMAFPGTTFESGLGQPLQGDSRTLSMIDPNTASRWTLQPGSFMPAAAVNRPRTPNGKGYAPSIAPSERSNVGMAPRYRPVSTVLPEQAPPNNRSSSLLSAHKPWVANENRKSSLSLVQSYPEMPKPASMATVQIRAVPSDEKLSKEVKMGHRRASANDDDDDDDDQAWAEMMKKREKKKSGWKFKRGTASLSDLLNAVH